MACSDMASLTNLPRGLILEQASITTESPSPYAIEERLVERAIERRKHEFRAGRRLARQALARLHTPACALPSGPNREPVWPGHLVGSISHSTDRCVVAAGLRASFDSIGIDIEADQPLPPGIPDMVFTAEELRRRREPGIAPTPDALTFSAKESIFKCLFPLVGEYFDFKDVSVRFEPGAHSFSARLTPSLARVIPSDRLHGLYRQTDGHVLTLVYVSASANAVQ